MDEKRYIQKQIKDCRKKMNVAGLLEHCVCCMAVGGLAAMILEALSLFIPFYYVHAAAGICVLVMLVAGIILSCIRRSSMKQAAGRLDSFGLKERTLTAYERLEEEGEFVLRQRKDAAEQLAAAQDRIRIRILPDKRHLLAFFLSAVCAVVLALIPTQARNTAQEQHAIRRMAEEKIDELEEVLEKLEEIDTAGMTEEQKAKLEELLESMELSREELQKADSKEKLENAEQKLDYKYQQTAEGLENLEKQLTEGQKAQVAEAKDAVPKTSETSPEQQVASGDGGETGEDSTQKNGESGDGSNKSDGNNGKSGDESQNGDGSGNGSGSGDGKGNGNGSGSGKQNGGGNGRGTGSQETEHDYVSVPNKTGDDAAVSGKKDDEKDSDYYRAQNGLTWEGDHVSLDSVIGEYTEDAYEGISSGKYPSGMEDIIKDYFKNLND